MEPFLWVLVGLGAGIAGTLATIRAVGWNRHRQLRALLDWLHKDPEARKIVDLRADQRIQHMRGQLP